RTQFGTGRAGEGARTAFSGRQNPFAALYPVVIVWPRHIRFLVATWTNLKTLGFSDPLKALEQRVPAYFERYADEEDEFGYSIKTFARWEPIFRFLMEDYFK